MKNSYIWRCHQYEGKWTLYKHEGFINRHCVFVIPSILFTDDPRYCKPTIDIQIHLLWFSYRFLFMKGAEK